MPSDPKNPNISSTKMKIKKSIAVPVLLLIYLAVMAYIGLPRLHEGHYWQYFGIIAATLAIIVLLHFSLKYREQQKNRQKEDNMYTNYADNEKDEDTKNLDKTTK